MLVTPTSDPLQSGQTVGVSSTAGPSTAATTPAFQGAPQLSASGSGFDGALTVAQYQGAPASGFSTSGSYFDVNVGSSDLGAGGSVQVVISNLAPGAAVFWLNGGILQPVKDASGQAVTADASGTARVTLTAATSPSLAQLTGTPIWARSFQPTLPASGGTAVAGTGVPPTAPATPANGVNEAGSITPTPHDPSGNQVVNNPVTAGNGNNTLMERSVNGNMAARDQVLSEWVHSSSSVASVATSRSQPGAGSDDPANPNSLGAGSGQDLFWALLHQHHLNNQSTDLLN